MKEQHNVVGLHYTVDTFLHEQRNPQIKKSIRKMSDTSIFDQAPTRALVTKVRTHQTQGWITGESNEGSRDLIGQIEIQAQGSDHIYTNAITAQPMDIEWS